MNAAFVVGCTDYDDSDINRLDFAGKDATAFAGIVTDVCGVDPDLLVLLPCGLDKRRLPTRSNLIRELANARSIVSVPLPKINNLIFFFSGHGFHSDERNADYIILQDAVAASLEDSCLSIERIASYLSEWKAEHTILFLDVCRAVVGSGKTIADLPPVHGNPLKVQGSATFWSCSPGQKSYEAKSLEKGVFTAAVLKALSSQGKCKTIYELDRYLTRAVPQISKELSLPIQIPFSRVEPLSLQDTVIISDRAFNKWQELGPLGTEIRQDKVPLYLGDQGTGDLICGLDFGTTHSAITTAGADGDTIFVPSLEGRALVPSVVSILPNLDYLVGWKAVEYGRFHPESTFYNIKRSLGTSCVYNVAGRTFTPEYLGSLIIRSLKLNAEQFFGKKVGKVMVSAPANFTIQQCNAVLKACHLAGLEVLRLVAEPSAAAVIVVRDVADPTNNYDSYFVLDLGGGTFDVSVIELGEGVWEIKSAGGDRNLGGLDYDDLVSRYVSSIVEAEFKLRGKLSQWDLAEIRREAERAKIALSTKNETTVILQNIEAQGKGLANIEIPISRSLFEALTEDLNFRVEKCILDALKRSFIRKREIKAVWSTGQGAKIFTVGQIIRRLFPEIPIITEFQENAVALGLGRYTGVLSGKNKDVLLLDATTTSIGIRCCRRIVTSKDEERPEIEVWVSEDPSKNIETAIILPRDVTIPTLRNNGLSVFERKSGRVVLDFVEIGLDGEEIPLGQTELSIPSDPFRIQFDVDANRTIVLEVICKSEALATLQINNFAESLNISLQPVQRYRPRLKLLAAKTT